MQLDLATPDSELELVISEANYVVLEGRTQSVQQQLFGHCVLLISEEAGSSSYQISKWYRRYLAVDQGFLAPQGKIQDPRSK